MLTHTDLYKLLFEILTAGQTCSYAEMDTAFLRHLEQLTMYTETRRDELFAIWLKATDHREPEVLTPDESMALSICINLMVGRWMAVTRQN